MEAADLITRALAGVSFALYVSALSWGGAGGGVQENRARLLWSAGCVCLALHFVCAFHWLYHWDYGAAHEATVRQTLERMGIASGAGLPMNFLMLLLWGVDALWWWLEGVPRGRHRLAGLLLQVYLAFMWLNATVVFGSGWARWTGVAGFVLLGIIRLAVFRGNAER
jgi:hypothetical protein